MKEDIRISLNGLLPIIFLDMWGATNPTNPTIPPRWTDEAVSIPTKTIDINLILLGFTERVLGIFPPRSNTFKLLASINAEKIDTTNPVLEIWTEFHVLAENDPVIMANTSEGNTLPYDITPALSDSDNAPSAIPTKASFIGVKLSFEVVNAKTMPIIKAPAHDNKNKDRLPVGTIPAIAKDIKNTAPPPTPNRFGSPKGDLVEVSTPAGIKNFEIIDVKYI